MISASNLVLYFNILLVSTCIEYDGEVLEPDNGLCGVHIERDAVDKHANKMISRSSFLADAKDDIRMMRNDVGSQEMFETLVPLLIQHWTSKGESVFAIAFSSEYFKSPYNKWNVNSFSEVYANPIENQPIESSHRNDKRDNFGAGARNKVSLSEYATRSIFRMLDDYALSHSGRSISLEPEAISTHYPKEMLNNAKILLEHIVDNRVAQTGKQNSQTRTTSVAKKDVITSNFYHIVPGSTLVTGKSKSLVGYIVFNSKDSCVQDYGPGKGVSKEIALQYIDCVLNGRFHKSLHSWDAKKLFVRSYHLLSYKILHIDTIAVYEYHCRCKTYRGQGECDHQAASEHILATFDVHAQVHQIKSGTVRGRPKKSASVKYAAPQHVVGSIDLATLHARDYEKLVREPIVQFFDKPFSKLPFVGTVTGTTINNTIHYYFQT
jgi:hypothetical protein